MTRTVPAMLRQDAAESLDAMLVPRPTVWLVSTHGTKLCRSVKLLIVDRGSGEPRDISRWVSSVMGLPVDDRHGGIVLARYRRVEDLLTGLSYRILGQGGQLAHRWI